MPVGGGPAAQKITPGKVSHAPTPDKPSHAPTPDKPSHVSTRHTAVHVPLVKSFKIKPGDSCPGCTDTTGAQSTSPPTPTQQAEIKEINIKASNSILAEVIAKANKKFPWVHLAMKAGAGKRLSRQDAKLYAQILSQISWVKSPEGAAYHKAFGGIGIPNDGQLVASNKRAVAMAHGNTAVTGSLNTFFNSVGNSYRYQSQNFPGQEDQIQEHWDITHQPKSNKWLDIFLLSWW